MKLSLIVLSCAVAVVLSGCATSSKTYTPDGREGCSGQLIPDTSIGGFDAIARS